MKDIFGKALMDYFNGVYDDSYFLVRDDEEKSTEPIKTYFKKHEEWNGMDRWLMNFVEGEVLDIGAGAGRHTLFLQEKSYKVQAIDISEGAIEVMKRRGVRSIRHISIKNLNFPEESFDTVLLMANNFGLMGSIEKTKEMLTQLSRITTPRGRIIATIRDPYRTAEEKHLRYHERNREVGRPEGLITLKEEYKGETGEWIDLLMPSPEELKRILEDSPWKVQIGWEPRNVPYYGVVIEKR